MYRLEKICKQYGDLEILNNFNINFEENKVSCLFGPSGCGKTTILKILSGLEQDYTGKVTIPSFIGISFIFQETRLIPWLTVYDNLAFILENTILSQGLDEHICHYLKLVDLFKFKDAYPGELSGGMKQRVAIARAFAFPHKLLLLDEPFQGLDAVLKDSLTDLLKSLIKMNPKTVVLVTHDIKEAKMLSDTIYYLDGRPLQITKTELN